MRYIIMILCFTLNLLICIGVPIGVLIYLLVKKKEYLKPFLMGVVVFVVSQVCLRIPLLNIVLAQTSWYQSLSNLHPISYSIFLGITAGIFEEVGRYCGFNYGLKRNRSFKDGVAFALGHGGIEAILLAGISSLYNLLILLYISFGHTSGTILGVDIQTAIASFSSASYLSIIVIGIERIFAMCIHLGLTMLVLYGVNKNKIGYLLLAMFIHGVVDFGAVLLGIFGFNTIIIESWCLLCALIAIILTMKIKRCIKEV